MNSRSWLPTIRASTTKSSSRSSPAGGSIRDGQCGPMPLSLFLMLIPGLLCFLCALRHPTVSLENLFSQIS